MALPKLDTPTYELEQPSTGEMIKYRPFLVREQKQLMMAQESEDETSIKNAMADVITQCTFEKINPLDIPLFDVELLFLRIRSKSVGENVDLNLLLSNAFFNVKHLTSTITGFRPAFFAIPEYEFTSDNFEATNNISIVLFLLFLFII